jgi:hypothetical protein
MEFHISDIKKFKTCRQLWYYSSPLRMNLAPRRTPEYFLSGKGVHYGASRFYEDGEHPLDAFDRCVSFFKQREGHLWGPKTLEAIRIGRAICMSYHSWVTSPLRPDLKWKVLATEISFGPIRLPVPGTSRKSTKYELSGRFDQVLEDLDDGNLWLREFKTTQRTPVQSWLDNDDQLTSYCWAIQQILGRPVVGIQYRFLMKKAPEMPPLVQNGTRLSKAIHSNLSTTYDLYLAAIKEHGFNEADYREVLDELLWKGWSDYIIELPSMRSQGALQVAAENLFYTAYDMADNPPVYPSPDWIKCQYCPFASPCQAAQEGHPELEEKILAEEYGPQYREKNEEIDAFIPDGDRVDADLVTQDIAYDE